MKHSLKVVMTAFAVLQFSPSAAYSMQTAHQKSATAIKKEESRMSAAHSHSSEEPQKTYLKDYAPPSHAIDKTDLTFDLIAEDNVIVTSKLQLKAVKNASHLELHGNANMELIELKLDGQVLKEGQYKRIEDKLILDNLPVGKIFTLESKVRINPKTNKSLNGLYTSGGKFTTQCESEGFRNITFYLDRPDVMSEYTVTIIADKSHYPQLLSNGNKISEGKTPDGRDSVTWHDPSKKPSYLFALVAGDLDLLEDDFTTMSGKKIDLRIYVDKGQLGKASHAMQALKDAMKWDEEKYGREYDLNNYMIVAVDDFNFGAMENKGLNIFNSSAVLADPQTATDARYGRIQQVVGHEYFHNWSGNRVTVRDWFQISLKEGFTNYRDQTFSADMGNKDVSRIEDVAMLRATQFPEDAGPMAHPIRPDSFVTIENFYTTTVYEKGAEVIGMMKTILGEKGFRKGTDLYFSSNDGKAVTTEDFVQAMEKANNVDLSQFEKSWYSQAGTPELKVTDSYDAAKQTYSLTLKQYTPATPGQPVKQPYHIPVRLGLLNKQGKDIPLKVRGDDGTLLTNGNVLNIRQQEQTFVFENVKEKPLPSLLREFSAPVKLHYGYSLDDLTFLLQHDSDSFNRWEAAQNLGVAVIKDQVKAIREGKVAPVDERLITAYKTVLNDKSIDQAVAALLLTLPGETYLAELYLAGEVDVQAIHNARKFVRKTLANRLEADFKAKFDASLSATKRPYAYNKADIAERSIRNTALSYLLASDNSAKYLSLAKAQYDAQQNMTDVGSAFSLVVNYADNATREAVTQDFYNRWKGDALVMNQWFSTQSSADRDDVLETVKALMQHPSYDKTNPNKVRALIGGFGANTAHFHRADGAGYKFLADQVLDVDGYNPQLAVNIARPLTTLHKFEPHRRALMQAELERIMAYKRPDGKSISKNLSEVISSALKMIKAQKEAA